MIAMLNVGGNKERRHMVRLFIRHKVSNYAKWRKAYNAFDKERPAMGVLGHAVFQSTDDRNDVTVWHDFATTRKAKAFASSEKLKAAMRAAGVRGAPKIWFTIEAS
jgi:hypothetical protein